MVTSNILLRTFFIKAEAYGTAFTLEVDGEEFLVTARHLLNQENPDFEIKIFHADKWQILSAEVVGHGRGEIDISVLKLRQRLSSAALTVTPTIAGLVWGQDVYFLGFPYKMWGDVGNLMGGMPCAYAKKGTVSSFKLHDPQILHIDAINNEGFSGGPLFFYPLGKPDEVCVAGVVSKFRIEHEYVIDAGGEPTKMTVPYNSGFLIAYGSKYILDIISAYRESNNSFKPSPSSYLA
ncbi:MULTISPECIES: S1 family peptidase [Xanthomonas]|uniref:S1 family peptidase n=1 Tax=Xanthomonas TaxID=338 RepID=UPI001C4840E8|nr:serine protease [Xanthomonas euvesicatoria]MBV6777895.1 serine protease [Xanthomonas campestris pv. carissae]